MCRFVCHSPFFLAGWCIWLWWWGCVARLRWFLLWEQGFWIHCSFIWVMGSIWSFVSFSCAATCFFMRHSMCRVMFWRSRGRSFLLHMLHVQLRCPALYVRFSWGNVAFPPIDSCTYVSFLFFPPWYRWSGYWVRVIYRLCAKDKEGAPAVDLGFATGGAVFVLECVVSQAFLRHGFRALRF